ncbi:MAG: cation diffusion facilitator family transporter [Dissulfuribacterales bacterium]
MSQHPSNIRQLGLALLVTAVILAAEITGGILSNSLALMSDAGHVLTDGLALLLSLVAGLMAQKPADFRATYGYQRIGILAALINGASLVVIALLIFWEAYRRLQNPMEIQTGVMIRVATLGLAGNLLMAWLLHKGHHDLNVKSAWLHVLGDTLSSVAVVVAGIVISFTGFWLIDPLLSVFVGLVIVVGGIRVVKDALLVFLEMSPLGLHAEELAKGLMQFSGVWNVHDVHLWSIGYEIPAFSAHISTSEMTLSQADALRKKLENYLKGAGITHTTLQMECSCSSDSFYCRLNSNAPNHQCCDGHNH